MEQATEGGLAARRDIGACRIAARTRQVMCQKRYLRSLPDVAQDTV